MNEKHDVKIVATAPGSVMLMGEHSVVHDGWAIACALDKYIKVVLTPRNDNQVIIRSELSHYHATIGKLNDDAKLRFVLKTIESYTPSLTNGFELDIHSEFSHTLGLGSSAAVTVACIAVIAQYSGENLTKEMHLEKSLSVVRSVQGRGSGTDLAASIYGGVVAYKVNPCEVIPLSGLPIICLHYVGYKMKTPDVLAFVDSKAQRFPNLYAEIYQLMNGITKKAIAAIEQQNWPEFGELMNLYQGQMDCLGVNDLKLSEMVYTLRKDSRILGAKISGSGLGDCVISLGAQIQLLNYQQIKLIVAPRGVTINE